MFDGRSGRWLLPTWTITPGIRLIDYEARGWREGECADFVATTDTPREELVDLVLLYLNSPRTRTYEQPQRSRGQEPSKRSKRCACWPWRA